MIKSIISLFRVEQAYAASTIQTLMGRINEHVLNPLITLLFAVAFVRFIVGLFKFFGNRDNSEELETGKRHMIWGIIGMVIMVSVFGIMSFITSSLQTGEVAPDQTGDVSGLFQGN